MINESKIGEVNYTLWEIVRDNEELCEIKMQQKRRNHKEILGRISKSKAKHVSTVCEGFLETNLKN